MVTGTGACHRDKVSPTPFWSARRPAATRKPRPAGEMLKLSHDASVHWTSGLNSLRSAVIPAEKADSHRD